jgi:hypothetical protein
MLVPDRNAQGPQLTHSMPYVPQALRDQVDRIKRPANTSQEQGLVFASGLDGLTQLYIANGCQTTVALATSCRSRRFWVCASTTSPLSCT